LLLAAGSLSAQTVIDTSAGHVALTNATLAPGDAWTKTGAGTLDARAATVAGILSHTAGNLLIGGGNIAPGGTLVLDGGDVTLARPFGLYEASAPAASWDIAKSAAFGYLRRTTNAVMAQRGATGWGDYIVYRYTGHWHVPADGPYSFLKDFDDAARLSIDGGVILENTEAAKTDALKSNVTLTEGWHDIELLFWNVTGQVGPRSTDPLHTSGLMWSSGASFNINTAKSFFLSDNLDLIADGAPNRFDGNVVLKQSAALTVPADAGSFGGFASLTLDPAAAPGTVLTVTTGSGAPIPVGAAAPVWAVFADDIPAAYPDGIVFTNRVWLASAPPANAAIADGAELALDGPALLGPGDIALAGHAVHITRPDSVGGTVTADTALEHIAFNTARLTGGTVTDHATNLFAAANNAVISGGASVRFTGAGTNLYTGAITGTGDIIKEGSGVTVLTGEGAPDPAAPQTLSGTLLIHNNILRGRLARRVHRHHHHQRQRLPLQHPRPAPRPHAHYRPPERRRSPRLRRARHPRHLRPRRFRPLYHHRRRRRFRHPRGNLAQPQHLSRRPQHHPQPRHDRPDQRLRRRQPLRHRQQRNRPHHRRLRQPDRRQRHKFRHRRP
jgi:hypothetical protein